MKTYFGLADCNGIESFLSADELSQADMLNALDGVSNHTLNSQLSLLLLRARSNEQRHPVIYMVKVSDEVVKTVNVLLKDGKYIGALTYLKASASEIQIQKGKEKRWNKIPNPELEP